MERHPTAVSSSPSRAPLGARRADTSRLLRGRLAAPAARGGSQEARFGGAIEQLSLSPSQYWARQCHSRFSFIRRQRSPCATVGVDRIMWGSDYRTSGVLA